MIRRPGLAAALCLVSAIAALCGALAGCERCAGAPRSEPSPPEHAPFWERYPRIVAGLDVHEAFRYFSGHIKSSGNNPAMYADLAAGAIVVVGRGERRVIESGELAEAVAAFEELLEDTGYVPEEEQDAGDPNRLVYVLLDDILPSDTHALAVFGPAELDVLKHVPVSIAFAYFSGNRGGAHDFPAVYGIRRGSRKLNVVGRGVDQEFDLADAARAFRAFAALLRQRGFGPASADAGRPDAS